jgi:hypothetical protein
MCFYMYMMFVPHGKHSYGPPRSMTAISLRLYVHEVRTTGETRLWGSTVCYCDSFTLLYVDDVRTSQKARPVTVIASLF